VRIKARVNAVVTVFAALVFLSACAATDVAKPSVNLLAKQKSGYTLKSFEVSFDIPPKSTTLIPKIESAIRKLEGPIDRSGAPAILKIHIKNHTEVGVAQSLLIGGSSLLEYSLRVNDSQTNELLYQIDILDREGYAPGGLIAVLGKLGNDEEQSLANKLRDRVSADVIAANNLAVRWDPSP